MYIPEFVIGIAAGALLTFIGQFIVIAITTICAPKKNRK